MKISLSGDALKEYEDAIEKLKSDDKGGTPQVV